MKIKISLVFLFLAGLFVYFVFKGGYIVTSSAPTVIAGESKLSGAGLLDQLSKLDLRDYNGDKLVLDRSELDKPQKLVIHFWASWCSPCVNEVPELVEYAQKNPDVKFVIVSADDYKEDIEKFMKSFPAFNTERFIRVWDVSKTVAGLLKVDRLPMSVLISKSKAEPQMIFAAADWKNLNF